MAFKALCDELRFDCRIVLGLRDGMVHAWNIVALYGEYYHIDLAMSGVHGIEISFLRTDADFLEMGYEWDMEGTVRCEGTLTYEDIRPEEPEEYDEGQENGEDAGLDSTGEPEEPPDQTGEAENEAADEPSELDDD
jgi:hypothetical protein